MSTHLTAPTQLATSRQVRGDASMTDPSRTESTKGLPNDRKSSISAHLTTSDSTAHRQVIGKYELGRILATGDFDCRTRLCTHITTGLPYVVRVYDKRVLEETKWMWDRVAESIRVQRTLPKNKHVLEMVECFESNTSIYIMMHMFSSMNIAQLFTDAAARATLLYRLQNLSRAVLHSSCASNSTGASRWDSENPEKDARHHAPIPLHALQTTDLTGTDTLHEITSPTPSAKNPSIQVSFRRAEKSARTSVAPTADLQFFGCGAEEAADVNDMSFRSHEKGASITSTAARTKGDAGNSLAAMAALNSLGKTVLPSHVPLTLIRVLFEQAVKGVLHLHHNNVVHTGIAPDHLLVAPDGLLRISNMVSCCFCAPGGRLHDIRGTRHTVPPEVLRGESYDPYLADAWALGVVLYFMLNRGRYPHDGASTLRHILHGHTRPSRPGLPPVALDLVARLMQTSPEERLPVYAILAHPFFSVDLPSIAEERAADAAEEAKLQAQFAYHHTIPSPPAYCMNTVGNTGDTSSRRQSQSNDIAAGTHRWSLTLPHQDSLISFGSGGSITFADEVSSVRMETHKDDTSGKNDSPRWTNIRVAGSPPAAPSKPRFAAEPRSLPLTIKQREQVGTSLLTASLRDSVVVSESVPLRPIWRAGLAPTRELLEDHSARVIQYHYRQRQSRRRFRAETRALVARSQKKYPVNANKGGIFWPQQSMRDHNIPLPPARRGVSTSSNNKTGRHVEGKSLSHRQKPGAVSVALTNKSAHSTNTNGVLIHTLADSHNSAHGEDDGEASFFSHLGVSRENMARSCSYVSSSSIIGETDGTATGVQTRISAIGDPYAGSQRHLLASKTGILSTMLSPRTLGGNVIRTADGERSVERTVKDGEPCPLCSRKSYPTRTICMNPYPDTPYLYTKGMFTNTPST